MNHNLASTSVVKALWLCGSLSGPLSGGAQIVRRGLSCPSIGNNLERDLLPLIEAVHPGAFDRADVHETGLTRASIRFRTKMDCRVEPGNDRG